MRVRKSVSYILGAALVVIIWEVVGRAGFGGRTFPPASDVVALFEDPLKRRLLVRATWATTVSATTGLAIATVLGVGSALVARLVPILAPGIERLATLIHAVPVIAFAPILIVVAGPSRTPSYVSALAAYFPIFVTFASGLSRATPSLTDLGHVLGGSNWRHFRRIDAPQTVPFLVDGVRLATPAAVLGAVIGEWFGASRGLGVLIVTSMQNFQIPQLWAAALVGAGLSLAGYGTATGLYWVAQRRFTL